MVHAELELTVRLVSRLFAPLLAAASYFALLVCSNRRPLLGLALCALNKRLLARWPLTFFARALRADRHGHAERLRPGLAEAQLELAQCASSSELPCFLRAPSVLAVRVCACIWLLLLALAVRLALILMPLRPLLRWLMTGWCLGCRLLLRFQVDGQWSAQSDEKSEGCTLTWVPANPDEPLPVAALPCSFVILSRLRFRPLSFVVASLSFGVVLPESCVAPGCVCVALELACRVQVAT